MAVQGVYQHIGTNDSVEDGPTHTGHNEVDQLKRIGVLSPSITK